MPKQKRKSIAWINNAKALCMLIVYLFHSECYLDNHLYYLQSFYAPFFVNCFFVLSGYLLFRKQVSEPEINKDSRVYLREGGKTFLCNVLFRIAIPSTLFALIEFFPKKIIRGEEINYVEMFVETFGGCTYWFTSALVIAELLFFICLLARKYNLSFYIITALIIASIGVYFKDNSLYILRNENFPWCYAKGMVAFAYLVVGGLYWKFENMINASLKKCNNVMVISFIFVLFVTFILLVWQCDSVFLRTIGCLVRNCLGVFMIIRICMLMKDNSRFVFIGVNSLGFYLLSGAIPNIYSIILCRFMSFPMPIILIFVFLLSIITAYAIMLVFTKYFPWLFDLRLLRKVKQESL